MSLIEWGKQLSVRRTEFRLKTSQLTIQKKECQTKLFELLKPERIGVTLTDEFMFEPEQSTSAIILHHPDAKYFNIS